MRAFEMPPHARMSLVQQLLLRSLVARFWREPYAPARLTRWGTELHDRFLLPHFVRADFADVLEEQTRAGFDLRPRVVRAAFRVPLPEARRLVAALRRLLELRQALEPWHVMGEEGAPAARCAMWIPRWSASRSRRAGLAPDRYVVTCNGRAVPLRPTGRAGEFVAGVRYRAWQPSSALHPTIGVHSPLTFDIVDTWMKRSEGGCQYHVVHPGGRSHETFPVNAFEAESRRLARFFRIGHTPGHMSVEPAVAERGIPLHAGPAPSISRYRQCIDKSRESADATAGIAQTIQDSQAIAALPDATMS